MRTSKPSEKVVERLSLYRRVLAEHGKDWGPSVFSYELAGACQRTAAQVRRDLMAVGYSGNPNKGYDVRRLLASIAITLDPTSPRQVAIVGMGHLGRAISKFLHGRSCKLNLAAAFDIAPTKIGRVYAGVPCFSTAQMAEIIPDMGIDLGVLAVPARQAQSAAEHLVAAGVTGILNFAWVALRLPPRIYVESIDMSVALEKVAFFARPSGRRQKARPVSPLWPAECSIPAAVPTQGFAGSSDASTSYAAPQMLATVG